MMLTTLRVSAHLSVHGIYEIIPCPACVFMAAPAAYRSSQAYQDNQQALQKAQQEKMQPIMNKIMTAIKNVGKDGGYVYIMDISTGIPYISDTLSKDVTNDVKAEMNKLK